MKLENGKYLGNNSRTFHMDGLIVNKTTYNEKVFEGWHFHENNHLSFILEGGNREERKNGDKSVIPGSIMLYHSGEWHRNSHTQHPSQNINIEIEDSFLTHYEAGFINGPHNELNTFQTHASLTAIRIYHDCLVADQHSLLSVHQQILTLLQTAGQSLHPDRQLLAGRAGKVAELLHDRWNENISLHDLSLITQLHPVTVSRHFSAYFKCSLGEYMRKIRVQKALAMIRQTEMSLTGIAYQCGFFDQSHFIRAFREQTGFLPKEFRKL
ncbi:helix-turn-helix transcriptional regulator [Chitinophaga filiformis]|uniref:AraC family transcriptional regulator n=1 Tax=Chitinophaga filiformis TaxID=104663 RepID=A0ABY4I6B9_CHIFI|nr:AraC family transcriptional regulator [Chitinophaga filiformis]UPK71628.1 AraC family transcriptional regulator [Chitinophaga filiformis]